MADKRIDTKRPVRFYDDRGKVKNSVVMTKVLYEDDFDCLCEIDESEDRILFDKETGEVLTDNYQFWYAENF